MFPRKSIQDFIINKNYKNRSIIFSTFELNKKGYVGYSSRFFVKYKKSDSIFEDIWKYNYKKKLWFKSKVKKLIDHIYKVLISSLSDDYLKPYYIHENYVIQHYKNKNYEILDKNIKVDHDGYDSYGPQSNLYDYEITYIKDKSIFKDVWHREYWFDEYDDDSFYKCSEKRVSNLE